MTGKKFGRYTVLFWVDAVKQWLCICECGRKRLIDRSYLKKASCDFCSSRERAEKEKRSIIEILNEKGIKLIGIRAPSKIKSSRRVACACKKCGKEIILWSRRNAEKFTGLCAEHYRESIRQNGENHHRLISRTGCLKINIEKYKNIVSDWVNSEITYRELGEKHGLGPSRAKQIVARYASAEERAAGRTRRGWNHLLNKGGES